MNDPGYRTLYLAGPMTGMPEHNYPAFREAARQLRGLGLWIINPADLNEASRPWDECMRDNLVELGLRADGLVLLPGWQNSRGATLEVEIARRMGWPIYRYELLSWWLSGVEADQNEGVVA